MQEKWLVTPSQKQLLRESWAMLQSNIESVGTVTFLKMFETHPETLRTFIPEVDRLQELELNEWWEISKEQARKRAKPPSRGRRGSKIFEGFGNAKRIMAPNSIWILEEIG